MADDGNRDHFLYCLNNLCSALSICEAILSCIRMCVHLFAKGAFLFWSPRVGICFQKMQCSPLFISHPITVEEGRDKYHIDQSTITSDLYNAWTTVEKLLSPVSKYPCLHQITFLDYHNNIQNNAWRNILNFCNVN